jgi:hypothetical protein
MFELSGISLEGCMKRLEFECPKCGRKNYVDMCFGADELIEEADYIGITCICGGEMNVSEKIDQILEDV